MADLLLKAIDATHADPTKDQRGCYKQGDPVLVRPTGWSWGSEETKAPIDGGKFVLIRFFKDDGVTPCWAVPNGWTPDQVCPDLPAGVARLAAYVLPERDGGGVVTRRRAYRVLVASLPAAVRQQLNTTGLYEVKWTVARSFVQNKATLALETATVLS